MAVFALSMLLCFLQEHTVVFAGTGLTEQAEKIVQKKTKSSDSAKKKLKKLFKYTEKMYGYKRVTGFQAYSGWQKDYALEMYKEKSGSCYHFAAAYAFLAKKQPVMRCVSESEKRMDLQGICRAMRGQK